MTPAAISVEVTRQGETPLRFYQLNGGYSAGLSGGIYFNGFPVAKLEEGGGSFSDNSVQEFVMPGVNRIEIRVSALNADKISPRFGSAEAVSVALHGMAESDFPSDENRLIHVEWTPSETGNRHYQFELPAKDIPDASFWSQLESINQLSDAHRKEIYELANSIVSTTKRGNASGLVELKRIGFERQAQLRQVDPAEFLQETQQELEAAVGQLKELAVEITAFESVEFQMLADKKLVRLVDRNSGEPIVRVVDAGMKMEVIAGRINGSWKLVNSL